MSSSQVAIFPFVSLPCNTIISIRIHSNDLSQQHKWFRIWRTLNYFIIQITVSFSWGNTTEAFLILASAFLWEWEFAWLIVLNQNSFVCWFRRTHVYQVSSHHCLFIYTLFIHPFLVMLFLKNPTPITYSEFHNLQMNAWMNSMKIY